jgi:hypothetical protein
MQGRDCKHASIPLLPTDTAGFARMVSLENACLERGEPPFYGEVLGDLGSEWQDSRFSIDEVISAAFRL